jgi:hypothetical protein
MKDNMIGKICLVTGNSRTDLALLPSTPTCTRSSLASSKLHLLHELSGMHGNGLTPKSRMCPLIAVLTNPQLM